MGSPRTLGRFRPSPGTVIGCAALVVACTGTATAATLITGAQIKNNSVTTKDVKNKSLRAGDFKRGTLPRGPAGATGATGPQGAAGPRGAAGPQGGAGLSDLEKIFTTTALTSDSPQFVTATCPAGKQVISTGYDLDGAKAGAAPNTVTDVVVDEIGSVGNQAFLRAYEEEATVATWAVQLEVLCARVGP